MCGIIGYSGKREAREVVLCGLHALEYRGYDSAGLTAFEGGRLRTVKVAGKIKALEDRLSSLSPLSAHTAIGHTRWATHGAPTDYNSHPHGTERVMLVHNGIIENYAELKQELLARGYTFRSETDTEVAAVLLDSLYTGDPVSAIRAATARIRGSFAFGILFADQPERIYAVRRASPLIVGIGEGEHFIASDVTAVLRYTKRYVSPADEVIVVLTADSVQLIGQDGRPQTAQVDIAAWDVSEAERGGYPHFMKKEIFEEPEAVRKTLTPRLRDGLPFFEEEGAPDACLAAAERITFVACGTAMHAAYLAKHYFERYARIGCTVEIASEFRYAEPILSKGTVVVAVSQSGETADTLAALRLAKEAGVPVLAVVNVVGSTIAREADGVLYTYAGPEIAVASTKAYTVQASLFFLLAVATALRCGKMTEEEGRRLCRCASEKLPQAITEILTREQEIVRAAKTWHKADDLFFIGRGVDWYAALEASLKLKEISYIHSEAYAAGELKHGTISLIEKGTPVVALSTAAAVAEKMASNAREVIARGAEVFAVVARGEGLLSSMATETFVLPDIEEPLAAIAVATVLQLYAYHTAVLRGCAVDQPRNLAKSVTVE